MKTLDKYIEIAKAEVGVTEQKYNRVKYNEWYYGRDVSAYDDESGTYAWCAVFISWCAYKAGIPESVIPKFALCTVGRAFYKERSRYDTDVSKAKKGDIIFINWSGGSTLQHVGIVVDVDDKYITTVEGNRSNAVRLETYAVDDKRMIGFAHPDFDSLDPAESTPEQEKSDGGDLESENIEKFNIFKKIVLYIIKILKLLIGEPLDE